jgi:argininosuccinate synthase
MKSLKVAEKYLEVKLYKGNSTIVGRESKVALYSADLASMDIEDGGAGLDYNPADAQGFIRINAVRLRAHRILQFAIEAGKK